MESRATVTRFSQVASEVAVLRDEQNDWSVESENVVKWAEVAEAREKEYALALKNCEVALSGLSALRRQHGRLEREYANVYGLVAQQNAFGCQILKKYRTFRSMTGTLRDSRTPVIDPDRCRESVPFVTKPQSTR